MRPCSCDTIGILKVPKDLQLAQTSKFQFALIGRFMMNKGAKPKTTRELKTELQSIWSLTSPWHLMPMGKGYFTLKFYNKEDKATAKSHIVWELSSGSLRLRDWVRYFNPYKESSSLAKVWVRIYYLPVELWHPEVLSSIGRWLGQPLKIDGNSIDDEAAHFARLLVEIDLAQILPEYMTIYGGDYKFHIEFNYEYLPPFCTKYRMTGHAVDKCRRGKKSSKELVEAVKQKGPHWQEVTKSKEQHDKRLNAMEGVVSIAEEDSSRHFGEEGIDKELSGLDLLEAFISSTVKSPNANRFKILEEGEVLAKAVHDDGIVLENVVEQLVGNITEQSQKTHVISIKHKGCSVEQEGVAAALRVDASNESVEFMQRPELSSSGPEQ
ncbi:uncharacterized protein LOC131018691 [Salvia miltiorrhiza]|uniref:uncharacterized protein LOC131018691 n=1 Tax=Salvia miltiorrhiza TaxID=226208 RepID=UPI0025AB67DC|nr:uncharacterized protein LOC131018691 [Salvia miltiorrhiza]